MAKTVKVTADNKVSIVELESWGIEAWEKAIDADCTEVVRTQLMLDLFGEMVVMIVDESGLLENRPKNAVASFLYGCGSPIVGDVLFGLLDGPDVLPPKNPERLEADLKGWFSALRKTEQAETYGQMNARHQKEVDEFPIGACFSKKQFEEMMQKWGLKVTDTKKILSLGAGCYIRKSDEPAFTEMSLRHYRERTAAIKTDYSGGGFIYQMFRYELNNHEYGYTGDVSETLECLGLTLEEITNNPALLAGFNKAKADCMSSCLD